MIEAVLVFNNYGKSRLTKFYTHFVEQRQQEIVKEAFDLVSQRPSESCSLIENSRLLGGDCNIMYRHYTTLYFVFCCDASESELAILDLIQVFVESLDKCFKNVCELDLIFHVDRAHYILDEIILGGVVLETNTAEILSRYEEQKELETRGNRTTPAVKMKDITSSLGNYLTHFSELRLSDMSLDANTTGFRHFAEFINL